MRFSAFYIGIFTAIILVLSGCGGTGGPIAPPDTPSGGKLSDYKLLLDGSVARWGNSSFPLGVYIEPPPDKGAASQMMAAGRRGIDRWDNKIPGFTDIFNYQPIETEADIVVRWEKTTEGAYTRVQVFESYVSINKIGMSEDVREPDVIELLMAHELGHVLGLGHSEVDGDLMFRVVNPKKTSITNRDKFMIAWLYSQTNYIEIRR